jgi:hypothetical protein
VMKFIKTHPMKIGLGVDRVNCGGVKLLCIWKYNRIRVQFVQLN